MAGRDEPPSVLVKYVRPPDDRYPLTDEQLRTIAVIEDEATRLNYDLDVAAAMVVNAYAESTLNPKAHLVVTLKDGRTIDAAGIFQITTASGKGIDRFDIRESVRFMVREMLSSSNMGKAFREWVKWNPGSVPDIASAFAFHIERPDNRLQRSEERYYLAKKMFPNGYRDLLPGELAETRDTAIWQAPTEEPQAKVRARVNTAILLLSIGFVGTGILRWYKKRPR